MMMACLSASLAKPRPDIPLMKAPLPGFAGNGHCPSLVKTTTGDYYLWVNDESGARTATLALCQREKYSRADWQRNFGQHDHFNQPAYGFPTGVTGKNGNQSGELSWQPVPGATSYNIHYSLMNGGPYTVLAGNTTNTDYVAGGLTNGQTYYFAVTAIQAGAEGIPSEQVAINPFDTSQIRAMRGFDV